MTEKQINKWLRRRFSPVGWVLLGYHGLMNVMVLAAMVLDMAKESVWNLAMGIFFADYDMDAILSDGWGYVLTVLVVLLILWAWKGEDFWRMEVFQRNRKMTLPTAFSLVVLCIGLQLVSNFWLTGLEFLMNQFGLSILMMLEAVSGSAESFSLLLYSAVLAPVTEELVFRGYVLRSLQPYGRRFAVLGSALLFGLFHGNLMQAPYAFFMGLLFGYIAMEYSVFWAVMLHVFNNLVLAEGLALLTRGMPEMMAGMAYMTLFVVCAIASVGILLIKRHEIAAWRRRSWIDRRCMKCLLTSGGVMVLILVMVWNMASIFFM